EPVAARIESFIDDVDETSLQSGSFQRISDDDSEGESTVDETAAADVTEKQPRERAASKKSRVGKLLGSLGSKKRTSTKRSSSKKAAKDSALAGAEPGE